MTTSKQVSESYWNSDFKVLEENIRHPVASFVSKVGLPIETYCEGVGFILTFANVTVFDTDAGLVLVDCGANTHAKSIHEELKKWRPGKPIHTCVYTHGHIDHCMGIPYMERTQKDEGKGGVRVIAHENTVPRFARYKKTLGYNNFINGRQFQTKPRWPENFRHPDITYQKSLVVEVGNKDKITLYLSHDKGETDDSTWIWVPEKKVICTGDLFIWASPNCGNPQKVQRYPFEWSVALKRMLAHEAEILFPGHGPAIVGRDRVRQALSDTAKFLDSICDQTLSAINQGQSLNEILHSIKIDQDLLKKPYLRPIYDDPHFIVHNLWRLYCGWWDFNPAHLRPVKDSVLSQEICQLTGGVDRVVRRANELADQGQLDLAVQFVEYALKAHPTRRDCHEAGAKIYALKVKAEPSTMAKGIYRAALLQSEKFLKENPKSNL